MGCGMADIPGSLSLSTSELIALPVGAMHAAGTVPADLADGTPPSAERHGSA